MNIFDKTWNFIKAYAGEIGLGLVAVRQFIVGDWFGGIIALVVGGLVYINNQFHLGVW